MLSLLNTTFTNTLRQGSTLIGSLLSKLKARSTYFENKACTKTTLGELNSAGLLKKASIITTPTAYNNGFIHSVKPEWTLDSELVTNGDFATNTDWQLGNGSSISDGSLKIISAPYNATTKQALSLTSGKTYKIVINAIAVGSAGSNTFQLGFGNIAGDPSSSTQYEFEAGASVKTLTVTASATDAVVIFRARDANTSDLSITNVSVKGITEADFTFTRNTTATRVNSQGLTESVGLDLPRINYENGCGSWLLEPETTNLITYSEDYTDNSWSHNAPLAITPNYAISPDGTQNATRLNRIGTGNRLGKNIDLEAGKTYNFSFYMKNNGGTSALNIRINEQVGLPLQSYTISNDFERYSFNFTATTTVTSEIRVFTSAADIDLFLWGVQLEEKAFSTSYIPTIGSTRTQNQDLATDAGNSDLISSTEGVLYAEIAALADAGYDRMISLSDGSNSNNLRIELDSTSNRFRAAYKNTIASGVSQSVSLQFDLTDVTQFFKVAVLYNQNDFKLYINGVLRDSVAMSIPILPSNTFDGLRLNRGASSFRFEGKIKCLAVFKETLTDAELVALTTA